jgi:FMN-dependent NADH-azoreductase
VRDFLRFLGIEDVEFIYAEGLSMGDERKGAALAAAERTIRSIAERRLEPLAAAA